MPARGKQGEIFNLLNHRTARHAYAWAHLEGEKYLSTRFVAVLELPPIKDAKSAVQASILADLKNTHSGKTLRVPTPTHQADGANLKRKRPQ